MSAHTPQHPVCSSCRYPWDEHVQGRCPPRVEEAERFFASVLIVGILCFFAGVIFQGLVGLVK